MPWRREWLPTPIFLPREFHGQRRLEGYGQWGRKESDTTESEIFSVFTFLNQRHIKNLQLFLDTSLQTRIPGKGNEQVPKERNKRMDFEKVFS